jgi:hypothetical protein
MAGKNRKAQTAKSGSVNYIDAELFIPELEDYDFEPPSKSWMDYEINILKKYYRKVGHKKLAEYFAKDEKCINRSMHAIRMKANELGLYLYK